MEAKFARSFSAATSPVHYEGVRYDEDDDDENISQQSEGHHYPHMDGDAFSQQVNAAPRHPPRDPRRKAKYNIFSRLFFFWLEPLLYQGARQELEQEDLYAHPDEVDSRQLLEKFNRYWEAEMSRKRSGQSARLWVALSRCILWRLVLQGILILFEAGVLLLQSVILGLLTEYFGINHPTTQETRDAYLYAFGLVALSLVVVIMHSHSFLVGQKMSMILRVISTAAIYQKVLSLSQATISHLSVGHIVNLASNDVQRFDPVFPHLPYMWVSPIHLTVFTYLVYLEVGWSAFLATGFILLQVPLQIIFARLFVYLRFKSASLTDKRIHIMNEVISGIRVIKMYAWEYAFKKIVEKIRKNESGIIFKGAIIRACNLAYMIVSTSIIMWLVLTVHIGTGGDLSTRQVFTTLSLLTSLRLSSYFFVLAILGFSEGRVAIHRIQNLLEYDELHSSILGSGDSTDGSKSSIDIHQESPHQNIISSSTKRSGSIIKDKVYPVFNTWVAPDNECPVDDLLIKVDDMSASWTYSDQKLVLEGINFEVNESIPHLTIVGPVGSGKSSLLQCLLGELHAMNGSVTVKGSLSYVSQEPWVFAGTIRDNILFGEPYDHRWYERVLDACSLDEDINELLKGDLTLVGERGVTLSGGQKARISLARAIYHDADIFLLDDPLSALDVNVAMHIYDKCIRGLLGERLVVFVTHQIQFAFQADRILLIRDGHQVVYSSQDELLLQGIDTAHLMGLINDEDDGGEDDERDMFYYKDFDPPSPTTISMLTIDPLNDGHITPFSFASMLIDDTSSNIDSESRPMTPLALFTKSVRESIASKSEGTGRKIKTKKPILFPVPISESEEIDSTDTRETVDKRETDIAEEKSSGVVSEDSQQDSNSVPTSWPFAKTSPSLRAIFDSKRENSNVHTESSPTSTAQPQSSNTLPYASSSLNRRSLPRKPHRLTFPVFSPGNAKKTHSGLPPSGLTTAVTAGLKIGILAPTPPLSRQEERPAITAKSHIADPSSPVISEIHSIASTPSKSPKNLHPNMFLSSIKIMSPKHIFSSSPQYSPINSPVLERKRRNGDINHVSIEPGRFDAASIYSARSMASLNSVVPKKINVASTHLEKTEEENSSVESTQEKKSLGTVSLRTYYDFFRAGGGVLLLLTTVVMFILGEAGIVISDWWLADWANCFNAANASSNCLISDRDRILVYTATTLAATVFSFSRAILFYFMCVNASKVLHNRMFGALLHAKVLFFDNNPIGRILNRFSKDVGFLDDLLPYNFCEFLLLFLRCLAVIITATASNAWLVFPAVIMIVLFILLRWYYLKTSRDVKRLESIARSPVYSHLSMTLQGLSTIRSYSKEKTALLQLHKYQNQHSQAWYLYLVLVRWFGLRVDILSVIFLAAVAFISIPLAPQLNAGLVGLGLTYTISLADMLQYTIRLSAEVENTMISAERIMEYAQLESEVSMDSLCYKEAPPSNWPSEGEIKMENVTFQYSINHPMVLQKLSFVIKKSEKVGIIGRTGAGKSSLISVLYRLAEPFGSITIDGIDTKSIGLHDLRKKMSIIPQDPVLFSGTIRYNLDPFEEYSDAELWKVLEQVQLKPEVEGLEGQLSGEVSEGGSNFSVGQRQLVCLARALLRKNKILILDEATANVDPRTDGIIQKAIHNTFSESTVLVIAHRLDTIMDSDKIMVLKNGKIREFDSPYRLLQDPNSKFFLMVEKTGLTASGRLHQMALESHLRRMFKNNGRITPSQAKSGIKRMSALFAQSLLQRSTGSGPFGLSRLQERRASILSSNSFPRALNEMGLGGSNLINANDPNLKSLRLPSDPNINEP